MLSKSVNINAEPKAWEREMTCIQGYELNIGIDWATNKHDICTDFPVKKHSFNINNTLKNTLTNG
jgi:hypothetical protein